MAGFGDFLTSVAGLGLVWPVVDVINRFGRNSSLIETMRIGEFNLYEQFKSIFLLEIDYCFRYWCTSHLQMRDLFVTFGKI